MNQQPLICLIHGHGVDATIWQRVDADLSAEYPVVVPDVAHVATHRSIDEYAGLISKHLAAEAGADGQVVLVGHSMGGYIALAFAERYPDRVKGLVLFHSTAYADDDAKKEQRRQTIGKLNTAGAEPFIESTLPKMVAPDYPADQLKPYIDRYRTLPADALAAGMEAIMGRPDRTSVLRTASFPVLLILGKQDQLIAYDKTATLAGLSDQIKLVTLDQSGHLGMIEEPEAAVQALRTFIDGLPA
ncbi:alpha/beta fold hydrolase [Spirosoma sp. 209]|uniref:alpha/beta fold hydrolase n=1 Tax=Spirosoma sp. 209 TaxID=1955701 RepID=UPI00098D4A7A|nr:alpha/beta hydrolase [Spirosoma sp. 209]